MSSPEAWEDEYKKAGIPSSYRTDPSGTLVWFSRFLHHRRAPPGRAVDLGCGRGRNSIYLSRLGYEVSALDFVESNIQELQASEDPMLRKIDFRCHDVCEQLPFPDRHFHAAIDIFCYKHQISAERRLAYRQEVSRVLHRSGYFLVALAAADDGYYRPRLTDSSASDRKIAWDGEAGVVSVLYSPDDLVKEFSDYFTCLAIDHKRNEGEMHGGVYLRSTIAAVFTHKNS
jgi:SAM-dependent methyltransferase